jgi:protein SCO1
MNLCRAIWFAALLALLAGCGRQDGGKFQLTDVTGATFGRDVQLTDHNGVARTLGDFRGKVVIVFFGFTHCSDVCPTALAEYASVKRELGVDGSRVQVLFVTVDPERDTPAVLRQYVTAFDPTFLGLHGNAAQTLTTAKEFKVFYQKQPASGGAYTVDHSAGTFVFDPEGRLRVFVQHGAPTASLLHDVRLLLAS